MSTFMKLCLNSLLLSMVIVGCGVDDQKETDSFDSVTSELSGLAPGQVRVCNQCNSLSLYLYNPAYHGTAGNPLINVSHGKALIQQTKAGTPNGWATVMSANDDWGWRFARVECLSSGDWCR